MKATYLTNNTREVSRCRARNFHSPIALVVILLSVALMIPRIAEAQWAAGPGETVRNVFGPTKSLKAPKCRGACGADCPSSCGAALQFECVGGGKLLRVNSYSCGTHQGCQEHDDCLDRCAQEHEAGYDCSAECHAEAVENWGLERAAPWAAGDGPFEGEPTNFQYTKYQPGGPEAFYSCPDGAKRQCSSGQGACLAVNGSVEPVFDTFGGGKGAVSVSDFRSGQVCLTGNYPSSVCQPAVDIQISGRDYCTQPEGKKRCTWYGFELRYRNANPAEPLICRSSAEKEDFLGSMVSKAIEARAVEPEKEPGASDDLGSLLGKFQQELNKGKSLDQIFSGITMTTADGQTVGGPDPAQAFPTPGVPGEVVLDSPSGHILVPIFELYNASPAGASVEHQIRCFQDGTPVVETKFRLHFAGD